MQKDRNFVRKHVTCITNYLRTAYKKVCNTKQYKVQKIYKTEEVKKFENNKQHNNK